MKRLIVLSIILLFTITSCKQATTKDNIDSSNEELIEAAKPDAEIFTIIAKADGWSFSTNGLGYFYFIDENGKYHTLASKDTGTPGLKRISDEIPPNQEAPANYNSWYKIKYQEQEYEYMSGGSEEPLTMKAFFVISAESFNKEEPAISISTIKIDDVLEDMDVIDVKYIRYDSYEIHLRGKPMLAGDLIWNEQEESYFLHCKSKTIIHDESEGETPLYEYITINNLDEMKEVLSPNQLKSFEAKESFHISFRFYGMRCYAKYGKGILGLASTDYYDVN